MCFRCVKIKIQINYDIVQRKKSIAHTHKLLVSVFWGKDFERIKCFSLDWCYIQCERIQALHTFKTTFMLEETNYIRNFQ